MPSKDAPSERSPLLANNNVDTVVDTSDPVTGSPAADTEAGPEAQDARDAREAQFEGLPDVKKQLIYILPALSVGIFLVAADQTLIAATSAKIGNDLNALNSVSWIATAYFLTLTSFQPLYGKLSDIFGRKACLLFAISVFGIACLFCGLAQTIEQMIAARLVAGIGGGGITTVISILMSDIVPLRERGTWQGIINIIFATGSSAGAPLGGLLGDTIGWRIAFIAQFPLCLLALLAVVFFLKLPAQKQDRWQSKLRRVDFPGAITLVLTVTSLLIGLDQGSNKSWNSPLSLAFLILFPIFAAIFFANELRYAKEPFAPSRIIFNRSLVAAYLCNMFGMAGWFGMLFYIPLYYQASQGASATEGGLRLLPAIIGGVTGSLLGGLILQKTGKYYWLTIGSYGLPFLGSTLVFIFARLADPVYDIGLLFGLGLGGLGLGSGVTTTLIALISNAEPEDQAIATACSYLFRSLGSVTGLSVLSAIIQSQLRIRLHAVLGDGAEAEKIVLKVRESLGYISKLDPQTAMLVREAYADSIRVAFGFMIGVLSLSFIASFFLKEKRLSK